MDENVDTAAEIEDNSCFLDVELETLQSIYINETDVQKEEKFTIVSIDLHPATADKLDEQYVKMTLKLTIKEGYPEELPEIDIRNPRGLSDEKLNSIKQDLDEVAENKKGNSMLFEIIEAAKDHLTAGNRPCEECAICLYGFHSEDIFTKTECYHYFHSYCLVNYCKTALNNKEDSDSEEAELLCPVCRLPISFNELEAEFPPPINGEEQIEVTEAVLEMQKKMNELYLQQVEKGGIIDLEAEKNKYLLEISNVPASTDSNPDNNLEKSGSYESIVEIEEDENDKSNSSVEPNSQNDSENISLAGNKTNEKLVDFNEKGESKKYRERKNYNTKTDRYNKPKNYDRDHNERYNDSRRSKNDDRRNVQSENYRQNVAYDGDRRKEKFYDYDRRNNVYDRDRKNYGYGHDRERKNYGYSNDRGRRNYGYGNNRGNYKYDYNRKSNRNDYDQRDNRYEKGANIDKKDDQLQDLIPETRREKLNGSNESEEVKNNTVSNEIEDTKDTLKSERQDSDNELCDRQHSKPEERTRYTRYDNRNSGRYNSQRNFRPDDRRNFRFNDGRKFSYRENRFGSYTSDRSYKDQDSRRDDRRDYNRRQGDREEKSAHWKNNRSNKYTKPVPENESDNEQELSASRTSPEIEQPEGACGSDRMKASSGNWGSSENTGGENWGSTENTAGVQNWGNLSSGENQTEKSWDVENSLETVENLADDNTEKTDNREKTDFSPNRKKFSNRNTGGYNRTGYPNQRYNSRYSNDRKFNAPRYSNYRSKVQNEDYEVPDNHEDSVQKDTGDTYNKSSTRQLRRDHNHQFSENDHNPQYDRRDFRKNQPVNRDGESPRYRGDNYRNYRDENGRGGNRYRQNYQDDRSSRNQSHANSDYSKSNSRTSTSNYNKNFPKPKEGDSQNSDRGQESSRAVSDGKTKEAAVQKVNSCDESKNSPPSQVSTKVSSSVNNSVPTSDFLPPMSSSVAPPPGFQNPSRKIVYGLAAANPPPGFNKS